MEMNTKDQWELESNLINYLATQLIRGRLGLFLGAGVSKFFGLPDWVELLSKLSEKNGEAAVSKADNVINKASYLKGKYYQGDEARFQQDVKDALYEGVSSDFTQIRQNPTLAAIGSLVMSSRRGSAAKVFTLNYDDLLERYLEYHGFTTASVYQGRHWAEDEDVVIYHPHGFLPQERTAPNTEIIISTKDYHQIMQSATWRPLLFNALSTHTFIYIGISGDDMHLQNLLTATNENHAITNERVRYSGVRFATKEGEMDVVMEQLGVFTHLLADWDGLPEFLFKICQAARDMRLKSR